MKFGGNGCKYSDMTPLTVYSWLLKAEHQKKVVEWSKQVLAAVGKAKMPGKAPNSSAQTSFSRASEVANACKGQTRADLRKAVSDLWAS